MHYIVHLFLFGTITVCYTQQTSKLKGKVIIDNDQLGTVHIINKTQGVGTINDQYGYFEIKANIGDSISLTSIQYVSKVYLVTSSDLNRNDFVLKMERIVNELGEVRISQYKLSGKIQEDIRSIPTYEKNLPFWNANELKKLGVARPNDDQSPVENLVLRGSNNQLRATVDLEVLIGLITRIFKKKNGRISNKEITDYLSEDFLSSYVQLPETQYYSFVDFLNEQEETKEMFQSYDELKILEFVIQQSKAFKTKYNISE